MHEESISQAEIDALVKGIMGQGGSPAAASGQDESALLQASLRNFTESAARALTELVGVPCSAIVSEISKTTALDASSVLSGQVLVGSAVLTIGLSGTVYYVVPSTLGLAMITQLYGGVAPSYLDESALGALAEGLTQMNQAGLARFSEVLGRPLASAPVEAVSMGSLMEAPGASPGASVVSLEFELNIGEATGRILVVLPREAADSVVQAAKVRSSARARSAGEAQVTPAGGAHAATAGQASLGHKAGVAAPAPMPYQTAQFPDLTPRTRPEELRNIDMLMDVSLQVTVELGRTRRQIREVLALGPGSVVELDKLAGEQVDVLVNGKLIAKGEVVVIDENYGVRVTDIISPADRVQSLK